MRASWLIALALTLACLAVMPGPAPPHAAPRVSTGTTSIHLVRSGETLHAIARRYAVTVDALVTANRLAASSVRLRIGQKLAIPGGLAMVSRGGRPLPFVNGRRQPVLPVPPRALVLALPDFTEITPLFAWPVDGQVSSTFGRRRMGWHRGIDIKADFGTPVVAAAVGTVVTSGWEGQYGRVVKIGHANGFMTVYAHNDENFVEAGERVTLGQIIAAVGRTGRATAHHVHFEIRQSGLAYNPLYMLPLPPRVTLIEDGHEDEPEDSDE